MFDYDKVLKIMNLNYIMNLDCRDKSNYEILENELLYLKPFSKLEEIKLENIERFLYQAQNKYSLFIQNITCDYKSGDNYNIWCIRVNDETNLKELACIYGVSTKEILTKASYFIYWLIKNKKVKKRG